MQKLLIFASFLGFTLAACQNPGYSQLSNQKCYKITQGSYTYYQAAALCEQQNAQLATLHKKTDNDAVAQYLSSGLWEEAWIGLQCTTERDCFWDDGTPYDYSNFNANPNFANAQNCVMLKAGLTAVPKFRDVYNGWTPRSCYSATDNALCEEVPKSLPSCGDYHEFEGYCYQLQQARSPTWLAAETVCAQQGGHLVSIHSVLENTFIFNFLKSSGVTVAAWVGLYGQSGQFYWADSSMVDYFNLAGNPAGEPACYAMSTANLVSPQKWLAEDCGTELPFLCERPLGNPSPVPPFVPPTTTSTTTTTTTTTATTTTTMIPKTTTVALPTTGEDPTAPTIPPVSFPTAPTLPWIPTSLPTAPTLPGPSDQPTTPVFNTTQTPMNQTTRFLFSEQSTPATVVPKWLKIGVFDW